MVRWVNKWKDIWKKWFCRANKLKDHTNESMNELMNGWKRNEWIGNEKNMKQWTKSPINQRMIAWGKWEKKKMSKKTGVKKQKWN